jgi:hypothetical protein
MPNSCVRTLNSSATVRAEASEEQEDDVDELQLERSGCMGHGADKIPGLALKLENLFINSIKLCDTVACLVDRLFSAILTVLGGGNCTGHRIPNQVMQFNYLRLCV